jgi:hypothetical protein
MNQHLRGEHRDARQVAPSAALAHALAHATAPADMLLYRGAGPAEAAFYRSLAQGTTARANCFVSASLVPGVAASVAAGQTGGAIIEIVVRKGQKGVAYIHPFPTYRYPQWEVLINVGMRLERLRANSDVVRLEIGHDDEFG